MNWMIRQITQLEVSMNCVERLVDYHQYDSERAAIIPGQRPPANWPQNGSITVTNLWLRYRSDLDPVLKGLTFAINGREKIGLCGRTGQYEVTEIYTCHTCWFTSRIEFLQYWVSTLHLGI